MGLRRQREMVSCVMGLVFESLQGNSYYLSMLNQHLGQRLADMPELGELYNVLQRVAVLYQPQPYEIEFVQKDIQGYFARCTPAVMEMLEEYLN